MQIDKLTKTIKLITLKAFHYFFFITNGKINKNRNYLMLHLRSDVLFTQVIFFGFRVTHLCENHSSIHEVLRILHVLYRKAY